MTTDTIELTPPERSFGQRMLDGIERVGNRIPHPAMLFVYLIMMIAVGLAEEAGLIAALVRKLVAVAPPSGLAFIIVLIGVISSIASDAGYLVLIPLGAAAYMSVGRHPLAGMAAGFARVSVGFGVNFLITPIDTVLTEITNEAIHLTDPSKTIDLTANVWFGIFSTILVAVVGALITTWFVEHANIGGIWLLILFILITAVIDLILTGAVGQWAIFAPIFIPVPVGDPARAGRAHPPLSNQLSAPTPLSVSTTPSTSPRR